MTKFPSIFFYENIVENEWLNYAQFSSLWKPGIANGIRKVDDFFISDLTLLCGLHPVANSTLSTGSR